MKKKGKLITITSIFMIVVIGVGSVLLYQKSKKINEAQQQRQEEELDIFLEGEEKEVFDEREVTDLKLEMGEDQVASVYNPQISQLREQDVKKKKKKNLYDFENPLWEWNLYGTNHLSLYTYFKTTQPVYIRYTIQVEDAPIPNFTRTLCTQDGQVTREHEYQLIGFVPGMENLLIMQMYDENDKLLNRKVFSIEVPALQSKAQVKLPVTSGRSEEQISNGLYTVFGKKEILLYDNSGVLRSEIPLKQSSVQSLLLEENALYYAIDAHRIVKIGALGQVLQVYDLPGYELYGEMSYNGYGDLWLLASEKGKKSHSVKDTMLALSLKDKKVSKLFCMEQLLPKMEKKAKKQNKKNSLDWIDLTGFAQINSDEVLVSSRELSSMIKIVNINSRLPRISFIIGEKEIWEGTPYKKKLLKKEGQEELDAEQASAQEESVLELGAAKQVFYVPFGPSWLEKTTDDSLSEGQYYITVWDSNYGDSPSRKDLKWGTYHGVGTRKKEARFSYIQKYLVDENTGLYNLADTEKVTYTKTNGSSQNYAGHEVNNFGCHKEFGEYDPQGQLIRKFSHKQKQISRVEKKDYKGFWFE